MKKANQKNLFVAHLIIGFSAVASANCPNSTQQAAMKSRAVVNDIYIKAELCKQIMGNSDLHRQYALLRNRNQAYFDRQSRLTEAFHQDEIDSMYTLQKSFNNNMGQGQGQAVCAETQRLLSELLSAGSEAELDRRIQAVTGVDAPTVAGCSSANTSSGSRPSNPSESGEGQPYGRIPAESHSAREDAGSAGEDSAIERPSFQQEPNAGIGALKIIASLYAPANLADRCAPTQPSFFDVTGDFYSIYNSIPSASRPFYSQSQRNPVWNGDEMSLISSDCSSFVSASIGAGGLKITKNQEINEVGSMPSTLDMLNWHRNPSSNNCFETVEFKRGEAAIQMGDIYVYSHARHAEIVTHVHSESDPLGFESSVDTEGNPLSDSQRFKPEDCREYGVRTKAAIDTGNGFNAKLISAQVSERSPYLKSNEISEKLLVLACEAHFSGNSKTAYIDNNGDKFALFRIKRDADGNIPAACISQAQIVHKGYDSVRACFAPNASN